MNPKISVIIPVYNVECYLKECLDSVVNQTLKNIEIILVDDGSPDDCPRICDEYATRDSRIRVIHKLNGGYGSAMNAGLDAARGEYIGIIESDDWVAADMYENLYAKAKETEADVTKGAYYTVINTAQNKKSISRWLVNIAKQYDILSLNDCAEFVNHHTSIWSAIYKNSWLKENNIRFVEDIRPYEDLPFIAHVYSKAKKISLVSQPGYYYRADAVGSSMNTVKKTILNYIVQRERSREIYLANDYFKGDLKEYWWFITYLGSTRFFLLPNNTYRKEFYSCMQNLFKKAILDKCEFIHFNKSRKKDFLNIVNKNYYYYRFTKLLSKIIQKIFSITNSDKSHKLICILGIKIKIKRKQVRLV